MKTKAAILWGRNQKWEVEEVELDGPNEAEVLVKLAASGLCHSDYHLVAGTCPLRCRSSADTRAQASSSRWDPG
jgi:Zn-dependent alcohol dehydrogenase